MTGLKQLEVSGIVYCPHCGYSLQVQMIVDAWLKAGPTEKKLERVKT